MSLVDNAIQRIADALENDPEFRAAMREDPNAAMAERGFNETHLDVHFVADTADTVHVVFPPAPNADLSDDELNAIAGGFHWTGHDSGRAAFDAHFSSILDRIRANRQW